MSVRTVPTGWERIIENVRQGGLIYQYPDGSEHVMTKEELYESVHGHPEHPPVTTEGEGTDAL